MADEKELSPEEQAKKDRKEQVEEQDNPPEPYPNQEQLNKIKSGETEVLDEDGDDDDGDDAAAKRKKAEAKAEAVKAEEAKKAEQQRALQADKPGGYQTR